MVIAYVLLLLIPLFIGIAELTLHGGPFFLFRNAGAAAGNSQDFNEDQGPGQVNAPGAPHSTTKPTASPSPSPSKTN
jgi:hypothetical protein